MALLTSYSAENLVIDSGLVVAYSKSLVSGGWSWTSGSVSGSYDYMWEMHRRARQSFRYVGMTYDAAQSCKAAMVSKYTRSFSVSQWNGSVMNGSWTQVNGGTQPMADIAVNHNEDGSYDVVGNVNEDDMCMGMTASDLDIAVKFITERSRNYEGGERETSSSGGS